MSGTRASSALAMKRTGCTELNTSTSSHETWFDTINTLPSVQTAPWSRVSTFSIRSKRRDHRRTSARCVRRCSSGNTKVVVATPSSRWTPMRAVR